MFKFLRKDRTTQLAKLYEAKLKEARDIQRNGDVVAAARITAEAEEIRVQLEAAEQEKRSA